MNAKEEMERLILGKVVTCASITYGHTGDEENQIKIELPVNHTFDDLTAFLKTLDFQYDDGYGGQNLFGYVWFNDGTWASRGEYDGSEWWEHNKCPSIPEHLITNL